MTKKETELRDELFRLFREIEGCLPGHTPGGLRHPLLESASADRLEGEIQKIWKLANTATGVVSELVELEQKK
jgi:hypothetical protein